MTEPAGSPFLASLPATEQRDRRRSGDGDELPRRDGEEVARIGASRATRGCHADLPNVRTRGSTRALAISTTKFATTMQTVPKMTVPMIRGTSSLVID